ncbi:maleylpyruvate isomerase family mycothiol-dependent enzyme [Kribbella sp. NPDC020789]
MSELSAERAREAIGAHTRGLAESVAAAGAEAVVPTAPGWTVADLVEHVGQTQNWVAEIIERRITDPAQLPTELAAVPADAEEWPDWLARSAERIVRACSDDALDAPVFNAAQDGRSGTRFWLTSMLNEAVIHGFDAAGAARRTVEIEPDVAAELISNHLSMLTSATWGLRRPESAHAIRGNGETLQLLATNAGAWLIERRPDGAVWRPETARADVTLTGPAQSLLLTLTRRVPLAEAADLTITGETALIEHWLENTPHVNG